MRWSKRQKSRTPLSLSTAPSSLLENAYYGIIVIYEFLYFFFIMWHLVSRGRGILYSQIRHAKKRSAVGCWPSQRLLLKFPLKCSRRISFVREQVDLLMNLNEGKSLRLLLLPHFYFSDTYLKYFYFFETTRLYGDIADWIIYNFQAIRLNIFANVLSSSIEPYLKDTIVFDRKLNDLEF